MPRVAVPLLDLVRWIREDPVEGIEPVALDEGGIVERVAANDLEVGDAVQD